MRGRPDPARCLLLGALLLLSPPAAGAAKFDLTGSERVRAEVADDGTRPAVSAARPSP